MNHLPIQEITYGLLNEKKANAIIWSVNVQRGTNEAIANCGLLYVTENNSEQIHTFDVVIDNETLQSWGEDDSVIDNKVLAYSPNFVKAD